MEHETTRELYIGVYSGGWCWPKKNPLPQWKALGALEE